jgi:hypothetical protein
MRISLPPPGPNGTIATTAFEGYGAAMAGRVIPNNATTTSTVKIILKLFFILTSSLNKYIFLQIISELIYSTVPASV